MNDRDLKRGDRIKVGRTYGKVGFIPPSRRIVWFTRDDGNYVLAQYDEVERVHGNTHREAIAA